MSTIVKLQSTPAMPPYRRPKQITLRYVVARAFPLKMFEVLCPVCSEFNRLPKSPRLIDQNNDWIFRCKGCDQQMLYNPWRDIPKDGATPSKVSDKPEPIPDELFGSMVELIAGISTEIEEG